MVTTDIRQSKLFILGPLLSIIILGVGGFIYLKRFEILDDLQKWYILWLILLFGWFLYHLILWVGTKYTVNSEGIIIKLQEGLLKKIHQEVSFEKISSLSIVKHGPLSLFFDYGEIEVFTIGSVKPVILHRVSNPAEIQKLIKTRIRIDEEEH